MLLAGAARPPGRGLAVALAEAGADVALGSTSTDTAETFAIQSIANEFWALGRRHAMVAIDYAQPESVPEKVRQVIAEFGPIDVLVNLAEFAQAQAFATITAASWRAVLEQNLDGAFLTCRAAGQGMLEQGRGSILNVVGSAVDGRAQASVLAAAQGGIVALSRSLALEWSGRVAVNAAIVDDKSPKDVTGAIVSFLAATLIQAGGRVAPLTGQVLRL